MGRDVTTAILLVFIRRLCTLAIYVSVLVAPWLAMIGTIRSSPGMLLHDCSIYILVVQTRGWSALAPSGYYVVCSWASTRVEFNTTVLVDIVGIKSFGNSLLNPPCVPIRVSIKKHNFVPERILDGRITVLSLFSSKPGVLI